ncbi:putative plastid-lipid-associated protein 7, chloroplastic [Vitis vinifera]|uniref:Putative plastid-lipid-associated protein 7, chloroplastic n=1 Tax=Vitis vinifera TaxID=29760 RepID=A0A438HML4_VITVI|nr:putative plastid-lipid-associated protein 7, chloroplastic [Vitis vinifera]
MKCPCFPRGSSNTQTHKNDESSQTGFSHSFRVPEEVRTWRVPSGSRPFYAIRVAEQSPGLVGDDQDIVVKEEEEEGASSDDRTIANVKADLYQAVQGINRGVFGVPSAKKSEIEALVKLLESQNPTPEPTLNLDKAKAVNVIKFNARGFNFLNGELKIEASFKIASKSRVDIKYDSSTITPDKVSKFEMWGVEIKYP